MFGPDKTRKTVGRAKKKKKEEKKGKKDKMDVLKR